METVGNSTNLTNKNHKFQGPTKQDSSADHTKLNSSNIKAQRGKGTCPGPHSKFKAQLELGKMQEEEPSAPRGREAPPEGPGGNQSWGPFSLLSTEQWSRLPPQPPGKGKLRVPGTCPHPLCSLKHVFCGQGTCTHVETSLQGMALPKSGACSIHRRMKTQTVSHPPQGARLRRRSERRTQ